jgi:hypothetical protein
MSSKLLLLVGAGLVLASLASASHHGFRGK